jgi:hypothetical protein
MVDSVKFIGENMKIVIHTYGRSSNQKTFNNLPKEIQDRTSLCVQKREKHLYKEYPNIIVLPDKIRSLSPTRQWLIQNSKERFLCMMDDDITNFSVKTKEGRLVKATDRQIVSMFNKLENTLEKYVHCGIPYRQLNRVPYGQLYSDCTRMMSLLCYDIETVNKLKCRFDRVILKQDFDMTLQLLKKGCPNRLLMRYGINVSSPQINKGGVTEYRTEKANTEAAYKLKNLHPEFVHIVQKETKSSYGGGSRTDVKIDWKKAFNSRGA